MKPEQKSEEIKKDHIEVDEPGQLKSISEEQSPFSANQKKISKSDNEQPMGEVKEEHKEEIKQSFEPIDSALNKSLDINGN